MAGISDAARAKLAVGDITAFDLSKVVCENGAEVGPARPEKGKKPDPSLHHLKVEKVGCLLEAQAPNARKPRGREKDKMPAFEQQLVRLEYGFGKGTKFFKKGEPQITTPPAVFKFQTLIELSGKWYCIDATDVGADGVIDGPDDVILVSEYDIQKGGQNWINRNGTFYTTNPSASYGQSKQSRPVPIQTPEGITAVQDTFLIAKTSEAPKGMIEAVRAALLGALQASGIEVVK